MSSADMVKFVSIDPLGSNARSDDTTIDYSLTPKIQLIKLQKLCSKKSYNECVMTLLPKNYLHDEKFDLYISNITPSILNEHSKIVNEEKIENNPVTKLVAQLNHMMIPTFFPTPGSMQIFSASTSYSVFFMGYYIPESKSFQPTGCIRYHCNPLVGTFVSFLAVKNEYRKRHYASVLLILLQALLHENMNMSKVLLWCNILGSHSLISFYRKLGFFPTIPSNYSLGSFLPSETIASLRTCLSNDFLLEVRELIWDRYMKNLNKLPITFIKTEIDQENRVTKRGLKKKGLSTLKCCICEIAINTERDAYVFCTAPCTTHHKIKVQTKEICGLTVCLTCQSNFGLFTEKPLCPIHCNHFERPKIDVFRTYVKKEYEKLQSMIDLKMYYNSCFENTTSATALTNDSFFCIHCKTEECSKNQSVNSNNTITGFQDENTLKYIIQSQNHLAHVKEMRSLDRERHCNNCKHSLFLDANIGSPSLVFQNKRFGIKNVGAYGDCGFLSIYIAIITSDEDTKEECARNILEYSERTLIALEQNQFLNTTNARNNLLKSIKFVSSTMKAKNKKKEKRVLDRSRSTPRKSSRNKSPSTNTKGGNESRQKNETNEFPLSIRDIRRAFFLAAVESFIKKSKKRHNNIPFDLRDPKFRVDTKVFFEDMFNLTIKYDEYGEPIPDTLLQELARKHLSDLTNEVCNNPHTEFLGLLELYSCDNTSSDHAFDVMYLDWEYMKYLAVITSKLLGVAIVIDEEYSQFGDVHDSGYYRETRRHMLQDCKQFVLIRYHGCHYEIFYDRKTQKATFPTKMDIANIDFDPANILLSYCDASSYFALSGELKKNSNTNSKVNDADGVFSDADLRFFYTENFNPKSLNLIMNTKEIDEFKKWKCYTAVFEFLFKDWFDSASKYDRKYLQNLEYGDDESPLTYTLKTMKKGDTIPVILFPSVFENKRDFKSAAVFLEKWSDTKNEFVVLDMNRLRFTSLHLNQNSFFSRLHKETESACFSFNQLLMLEHFYLVTLPDESDLNLFQRHVFSLTYQWSISQGSLYNSIYGLLGVSTHNILNELLNPSLLLEKIEILIPKCSKNGPKKHLYLLSILLYKYDEAKKNDDGEMYSTAQTTIYTRLYKYFIMFGNDFSRHYSLDGYLEYILTTMYKTDDFLVNSLPEIKKISTSSIPNNDKWAEALFEQIWIPLKVFEKKSYFNWSYYFHIMDDLQMKQNLSQMFKADSQEELQKALIPGRAFIHESVKRMFSSGLSISQLTSACTAYVDKIQYNKQKHISVGRQSIKDNLLIFKKALKFYMGYMHIIDENVLKEHINKSLPTTETEKYELSKKPFWAARLSSEGFDKLMGEIVIIDEPDKPTTSKDSNREKRRHRKHFRQKKSNDLYLYCLLTSIQNYYDKIASQSNEMRPFFPDEFQPIEAEVLPKLESSKQFLWNQNDNDSSKDGNRLIKSTDHCISIKGFRIDYGNMQDRLIDGWFTDEMIDLMIYLMMKASFLEQPSEKESDSSSPKPLALYCQFNTALEDKNYDLASRIFDKMLDQTTGIGTYDKDAGDGFLSFYDMLLIPINISNMHWNLIIIDFKNFRCFCLDSSKGYDTYDEKNKASPSSLDRETISKCTKILAFFYLHGGYFVQDYLDKNIHKFSYYNTNEFIPVQKDDKSCGVFLVMNIYSILKNKGIKGIIQENQVSNFRAFVFYVFSHFHGEKYVENVMKESLKSNHSIFKHAPNKEIISNDVMNILKQQMTKMNIMHNSSKDTNTKEYVKTIVKLREKKECKNDYLLKSNEDASTISDDTTDTESDQTEKNPKTLKSVKVDYQKRSTTTRAGDIAHPHKDKSQTTTAIQRRQNSKRKQESRKIEKMEQISRHKLQGFTDKVIAPERRFKLELKKFNDWGKEKQELFTQCEDELQRMTKMKQATYVGYHRAEQRYYLSSSNRANIYKNTMEGNLEIFKLHKEFINQVQKDERNGRLYRNFFENTLPNHDENWYKLDRFEGNLFKKDLEIFYTNEIAAYAFDKKDFTHLLYKEDDGHIWGRIYSGNMTARQTHKKFLYHEARLTQSYIEEERIKTAAEKARENPGREIKIDTFAASDQDQSICSKNDPRIYYIQGKKNLCFQYSLLSCLAYLQRRIPTVKYRKNQLKNAEDALAKTIKTLVGKELIQRTNFIMGENYWVVLLTFNDLLKRKRKDMGSSTILQDLFDYREGDQIIMANLRDNDGATNHYVAICDDYIFDSNFEHALPLHEENLSICCGSKYKKKIFQGFGNLIVYRSAEYAGPTTIRRKQQREKNAEFQRKKRSVEKLFGYHAAEYAGSTTSKKGKKGNKK